MEGSAFLALSTKPKTKHMCMGMFRHASPSHPSSWSTVQRMGTFVACHLYPQNQMMMTPVHWTGIELTLPPKIKSAHQLTKSPSQP
jgi:hypothetical protein